MHRPRRGTLSSLASSTSSVPTLSEARGSCIGAQPHPLSSRNAHQRVSGTQGPRTPSSAALGPGAPRSRAPAGMTILASGKRVRLNQKGIRVETTRCREPGRVEIAAPLMEHDAVRGCGPGVRRACRKRFVPSYCSRLTPRLRRDPRSIQSTVKDRCPAATVPSERHAP